MFNHTALKTGLMLAVLILAATNMAQAKIIESAPAQNTAPILTNQQALAQELNSFRLSQPQEDSRTITLNFGPLHFQEIFKHPLKACPT